MDLKAKKKLLQWIPSGLYVIGVKSRDEYGAFTASWFSQTSIKPPLVMMGVNKNSHSCKMIKEGGVFSVNYIRKGHEKTVEHFFKRVKHEEGRLGEVPFHTANTGAPILEEAIGYLECEVRRIVDDLGDHVTVIAEVIGAKLLKDVPPIVMSDTNWKYGG